MALMSSCQQSQALQVQVFETSASGNQLKAIELLNHALDTQPIVIQPEVQFQSIEGFGGAFTEATAHLLMQMSEEKRKLILEAYFSEQGSNYSLTRTHINSCDFSLRNYAYAMVDKDTNLEHFSIEEDLTDLIPIVKEALEISKEDFKILSSPWTAPPWMKDNKDWKGGKLLPEYYKTWALYFIKYIEAYQNQGIPIWGITVENEPLGNDNNWESMIFSPEEMNDFVKSYLGPKLKSTGLKTKLLGYDQNRDEELKQWADAMYNDADARAYYDGIAVHWYASTYDYFPEALQYVNSKAPEKLIIQTEACIDAEMPRWKDDNWYWNKGARDWGWTWAPENKKHLHPEYVPVFRYAGDIIGCLNNQVNGWIDWNMVLDKQGGPNWAKNWCVAPVIVDTASDEVYITPLYYIMTHFSKFIRPGAVRIGFENPYPEIQFTAVKNQNGSIVAVVFNPSDLKKELSIALNKETVALAIGPKAIQTIVFKEQ